MVVGNGVKLLVFRRPKVARRRINYGGTSVAVYVVVGVSTTGGLATGGLVAPRMAS